MMALLRRRRAATIRTLRAELKQGLRECLPEAGGLDGVCDTVVEAIEGRWPLEWVDGRQFARYIAKRIDPSVDPAAAIGELAVTDLYLACAVVSGQRGALQVLELMLKQDLPPALRTIDPSPDTIDEVLQLLREKLLVPVDGTMRLESYSGHGPLGAFLRVAALRTALSLKRKRQPELAPDDELAQVLDLAPNAEVKVLAQQAGSDLRNALRAAIAAQPARIRAVMRMYYGDNQGVEDIGRVYNVHASTVSRWLAKARSDILAQTRSELVSRLQTTQVDSLLGHAASLEISLASLLRSGQSN